MDLSEYVGGLRRELASLTRFASEDVARTAEMLAEALDSAVRLTLLDVLSAAASEVTARLDGAVIDVRLSDGEPEFVVTTTPVDDDEPVSQSFGDASDDASQARVTLRLSEGMKSRVESAAAAAGLSVNAWLVRAVAAALSQPSQGSGSSGRRRGVGQRYTGYARS